MPRKKLPPVTLPSVTMTPTTLRSVGRSELYVNHVRCESHPEGDGQMYVTVQCVGMDVTLCFDDLDALKELQKAINDEVAEEEERQK